MNLKDFRHKKGITQKAKALKKCCHSQNLFFLVKMGFLCRVGVGWFLLFWFYNSPSKNLFKIILIFIGLSSLIIVSSNS